MRRVKDYEIFLADMPKHLIVEAMEQVIREANERNAIPVLDSASFMKLSFSLYTEGVVNEESV
jgi:hypothetical protein